MLSQQSVLKHIAILACIALLFISGKTFSKDTAIDFKLSDINGKQHKLSDYRGKWVVVNFWATWCPPCLDEIPELIEFHQENKDKDAVVLGLNHEQVDLDYLKEFVEQSFINYPVLLSVPGKKLPFGTLRGLPTTVLVSPEGIAVVKRTGTVTKQDIEYTIKEFKEERK